MLEVKCLKNRESRKYIRGFFNQKIGGTSIVEVVVALIIIMVIFYISTAIILQLQKNSRSFDKYEANAIANTILAQDHKVLIDKTIVHGKYKFLLSYKTFDKETVQLHISAQDGSGKELISRVELLDKNEN